MSTLVPGKRKQHLLTMVYCSISVSTIHTVGRFFPRQLHELRINCALVVYYFSFNVLSTLFILFKSRKLVYH